jgi:hypothetical protein
MKNMDFRLRGNGDLICVSLRNLQHDQYLRRLLDNTDEVCNGQYKPDTFSDSLPIKIPFILQRGLITQF